MNTIARQASALIGCIYKCQQPDPGTGLETIISLRRNTIITCRRVPEFQAALTFTVTTVDAQGTLLHSLVGDRKVHTVALPLPLTAAFA